MGALKVFLVAGEASGDALGGSVMAGRKQLNPGVTFLGVGGDRMQAEGLESLFDMTELSVMGLAEVLPKYPHLHARMRQTADRAIAEAPDVIVTIDSPDFCLRMLKRVREARPDQRTVHYVAPSVWAWRPKRAAKMAPNVDQVLTLLPFEPPYMEAEGMRADFVGHPVVAEPVATDEEVAAFRAAHDLGETEVILALLGSRKGEVGRLADPFGLALYRVSADRPDFRVVVPAAPGLEDMVAQHVRAWPGDPIVLDTRDAPAATRAAIRAANVALAASGTVSLELAAAGTPMVIAYDMAWFTMTVMKAMARIDTVTLVNLVSETRVVPEFLGRDCKPGPISDALVNILQNPSAQAEALDVTMDRLGRGGEAPGLRAARAVLDGLSG